MITSRAPQRVTTSRIVQACAGGGGAGDGQGAQVDAGCHERLGVDRVAGIDKQDETALLLGSGEGGGSEGLAARAIHAGVLDHAAAWQAADEQIQAQRAGRERGLTFDGRTGEVRGGTDDVGTKAFPEAVERGSQASRPRLRHLTLTILENMS